jgi:hypothetical protein
VDFDSEQQAADSLLKRAAWLKDRIPVAMANLKAAQHRDVQRYRAAAQQGVLAEGGVFPPR